MGTEALTASPSLSLHIAHPRVGTSVPANEDSIQSSQTAGDSLPLRLLTSLLLST